MAGADIGGVGGMAYAVPGLVGSALCPLRWASCSQVPLAFRLGAAGPHHLQRDSSGRTSGQGSSDKGDRAERPPGPVGARPAQEGEGDSGSNSVAPSKGEGMAGRTAGPRPP